MSEPDFVVAVGSRLKTRFLGKPLHFFETIDSTNTYALQLAGEGAAEGTVVIADAQTGGRGRLGRSWVSPAGVNLYCSLILRPRIAVGLAPQVNLVAAVAVADTIAALGGLPPAIKWPNDVLLKGKKVCGILAEMQTSAERLQAIVLGIGVNLNARLDAFPEELREKASSLFLLTGRPVERATFTASLLTHLEQSYLLWLQEGLPALRPTWERYAGDLIGQQIAVAAQGEAISGTVLGLDTDGALLVREQTTETPRRVLAGEVSVIGGYQKGGKDHDPRD
jgi:BirA family biotin operon repressor/biotin-[acetyl-CoA-carboxylase] ligase